MRPRASYGPSRNWMNAFLEAAALLHQSWWAATNHDAAAVAAAVVAAVHAVAASFPAPYVPWAACDHAALAHAFVVRAPPCPFGLSFLVEAASSSQAAVEESFPDNPRGLIPPAALAKAVLVQLAVVPVPVTMVPFQAAVPVPLTTMLLQFAVVPEALTTVLLQAAVVPVPPTTVLLQAAVVVLLLLVFAVVVVVVVAAAAAAVA